MNRIASLSILLMGQNAIAQERPNVIIIYADDLGYGDLQCYGAKNVETPNVNKLASQGLLFHNVYACAATSTPSRYSLLTGEYAWRKPGTDVAAGNAGMIIRPEQFTLADVFKSQGYATGAIGKWHLGLGDKTGTQDWNAPLAASLGDLGFDYHYIMAATADRVPCVFIENGQVANWDATAPIQVSYEQNFPGEPTGKNNPELLYNLKPSVGHDMSIVNGISRIGYMKGGGKALWKDENIADSISAHAIEFLTCHKNEPFFLYLCTNDVHVPRFPHQRFRGKNKMGLRGEAIMQFDWTVGQITDALDRLGLRENTLIILTSDNGPVVDDGYQDQAEELLNGHKPAGELRGYKYSVYEGGTKVPAIVSWPGKLAKTGVSETLISQIDWMRSLATLISARMPKGAAPDSQNHIKALLGEDDDRDYVIGLAQDHTLSLRTKDWKYVEPSKGPASLSWAPGVETGYKNEDQLFDMAHGDEYRNVAADHPHETALLKSLLQKERK
ncbi:MAG: sulfatase-like hydrolase/transferase [Bacteroidales bacterium]|nr:sulfatase-like hydrolase/transferase [Bacteroidales bacterium]